MNYVDFYRDCISDPNHSTQLASTMAPTTKGDIVMENKKNGRSRIILKIHILYRKKIFKFLVSALFYNEDK